MYEEIAVETHGRDEWVDITSSIETLVAQDGGAGVVTVFVPHSTAGVVIQENADPPLKADLTEVFDRLFPWNNNYGHSEDNAAAHMKAVLCGTSVQIPFDGGKLALGQWQGVYLAEFDGPRRRRVVLKTMAG